MGICACVHLLMCACERGVRARSGLDLGGIDVKSTIAIMDGDFSGSIDYTEFLMATLDRKAFLTEDVMWTAFNVFDQNGHERGPRNTPFLGRAGRPPLR